jgi:hypothetical protein
MHTAPALPCKRIGSPYATTETKFNMLVIKCLWLTVGYAEAALCESRTLVLCNVQLIVDVLTGETLGLEFDSYSVIFTPFLRFERA